MKIQKLSLESELSNYVNEDFSNEVIQILQNSYDYSGQSKNLLNEISNYSERLLKYKPKYLFNAENTIINYDKALTEEFLNGLKLDNLIILRKKNLKHFISKYIENNA